MREASKDGQLAAQGEDFPNVSMLLNLARLRFKRLVVDGDGPLFSAPHPFEGGHLIGFSRDYLQFQEKNSDGIYFSTSSDS